ncbi:proteasome accessory factor PafA2 family protein, partial [Klebsiella pneumoniae]|nr:proteasome accessory factor PafA2 family protein [Klebsiella pneumoniae]
PHADADKSRRLHVIIGDANLAETATYLKLGSTALVIDMIEAGEQFDDLKLADPVQAVHLISHDPTLKQTVELADGRRFTGLDLQRAYHERAERHLERNGADHASRDVLNTWGEVLDMLAGDPMDCADRLDWPAKLRLLESYRQRDNLPWSSPRLHM